MRRYVIVGTGNRALFMFAKRIRQEKFQNDAVIVGVYDSNPARAKIFSAECGNPTVYTDFDVMLKESRADVVIVTTVDAFHHEYIIRAMKAGCDVISEKPMTTDAAKCRAILSAERETGRRLQVTFNMRYMPYTSRVKEMLDQKLIGDIMHVDLRWRLDKRHGADYFRRWHREMKNSGSLLIHKSTHHFDLVNWWLGEHPVAVNAMGNRQFYGPTREERGERCLTCKHQKSCEFYWDLRADEACSMLYLQAEGEDGYYRDGCVFDEKIDIYDTMSVQVEYENRALLSYSLIAYSPYEAWSVAITGTKGRIEAGEFYSGLESEKTTQEIRLYDANGEEYVRTFPKAKGTHGGGDERLIEEMIFGFDEDPLGREASSLDGAYSLLIGAAGNKSITEQRRIDLRTLLEEKE